MIFGSISLLAGTPGASQATVEDQVGSQVDFLMVFRCPGSVSWRPCGPFGRRWACLGATLGVTLAPEAGRGDSKRKLLLHIHSQVHFEGEKGRARTRRMSLKHNR